LKRSGCTAGKWEVKSDHSYAGIIRIRYKGYECLLKSQPDGSPWLFSKNLIDSYQTEVY
jgi:hypothetical protein